MTRSEATELTALLSQYRDGNPAALDRLARIVYPELKALARRRSNAYPMSATTLVQETFARFLHSNTVTASDRRQFFGLAATIMRRILVDDVRHALADKRKVARATGFDVEAVSDPNTDVEFLLTVDEALEALAHQDPQLATVFECRFFAGYNIAETAEVMGLPKRSTDRLWQQARHAMAHLLGD